MLKICNRCQTPKDTGDFPLRGDGKGRKNVCKGCRRLLIRSWRADHPEKTRYSDRKSNLQKLYGMTLEEYNQLLLAQGGVCAICKGPPSGAGSKNGSFHVDHCHKTRKIRGLLCSKCNSGLGYLQDDLRLVEAAAGYLRSHLLEGDLHDAPSLDVQVGPVISRTRCHLL